MAEVAAERDADEGSYLSVVARHSWAFLWSSLGAAGVIWGLTASEAVSWPPWAVGLSVVVGVLVAQWRAWEDMRKRAQALADRVRALEAEPVPESHAVLLRKVIRSLSFSVRNDYLCNYDEMRPGVNRGSFVAHFPDEAKMCEAWNTAVNTTHNAVLTFNGRVDEEVAKAGLSDPPFYGSEIADTARELAIGRAKAGATGTERDFCWRENYGHWYSWSGRMLFAAAIDDENLRLYQQRIEDFFYSVEAMPELSAAIQADRDQRALRTTLVRRLHELSLRPRFYGSCTLCARG